MHSSHVSFVISRCFRRCFPEQTTQVIRKSTQTGLNRKGFGAANHVRGLSRGIFEKRAPDTAICHCKSLLFPCCVRKWGKYHDVMLLIETSNQPIIPEVGSWLSRFLRHYSGSFRRGLRSILHSSDRGHRVSWRYIIKRHKSFCGLREIFPGKKGPGSKGLARSCDPA